MAGPINALELYSRIKGAWDTTNQPLKERASILPLGQYEDGSVGLAWPGLLAAPAEGMVNFGRYGYDSPEAIRDNAASAFDVAGGAVTGGLGVGLAGGLTDDAVRAGTRTYRGTAAEGIIPSTAENPGTVWSSTSPRVADFYAERAAGYADNDGMVQPLDIRGNYKTEGPLIGTQQWSPEWQAKIDAATAEGFDGVRFRNVSDTVDGVTSDWFAAARPGTVYSATTGELLYSNAPTGSSVPLAVNALERAGTDLPMDLASRMARAREMGFDTDKVLYHGTGKTFDEFNPGTRGNGRARNIYLTDNPEIADIYANAPNYGLKGGGDPMIYPVFAKSEKPLIVSDKGPDGSFGWVSDNLAAALGVEQPPPGKYGMLYDEARRQGYDQVQIREMTDLGGPQTQYIPLKPEYIRSVNAAFDPAKSDSANLLAANPYSGAATPLAGETQDDTDPALLEYLRLIGIY